MLMPYVQINGRNVVYIFIIEGLLGSRSVNLIGL
uniref:Uncharacterized protein n=1 Tax=Rhizophora mucronata TaxID=61149 RepID=A0A2P2QYE7_RHIMU